MDALRACCIVETRELYRYDRQEKSATMVVNLLAGLKFHLSE